MPQSRDTIRATMRLRREQRQRNLEALGWPGGKVRREPPPAKAEPVKMLPPEVMEDKMLRAADHQEDKAAAPVQLLEDLPWASAQALARAKAAGLTAADFRDVGPDGKYGYVSLDVRYVIAHLGEIRGTP